jgi:hypothetical protein
MVKRLLGNSGFAARNWLRLVIRVHHFNRKRQTKRMDEVFAAQAAGVRSATR